jgi:hypothetical protein
VGCGLLRGCRCFCVVAFFLGAAKTKQKWRQQRINNTQNPFFPKVIQQNVERRTCTVGFYTSLPPVSGWMPRKAYLTSHLYSQRTLVCSASCAFIFLDFLFSSLRPPNASLPTQSSACALSPKHNLHEPLLGQQLPKVRRALLRRVVERLVFKPRHRHNLGAPLGQEEVAQLRLGRPRRRG